MDREKKLEKELEKYQELAKQNPDVNVEMLMMNAIQNRKQNLVSPRGKKWAYLISIGLPPLGLLCALRYFLGSEDDAKRVAWICVLLTALGIASIWLFGKILLGSTGDTLNQLQQINPNDLRQLTQ